MASHPSLLNLRRVIILGLIALHTAQTANILFLHTMSSYSHRVPHWPLVIALVERGHNVTFISGYAGGSEMSHPNVTDLVIPETREYMDTLLTGYDINFRIQGLQPNEIFSLESSFYDSCHALHHSPVFQSWVRNTASIDLIFTDTHPECCYGLVAKFGSKHAIFHTLTLLTKYHESFVMSPEAGNIPPWEWYTQGPPLSYYMRMMGAILPMIWRAQQIVFYNWWYIPMFQETLGLEEDLPLGLYNMEAETSLLLMNGNYLEDSARQHPAFVVKVPGIHIRDTSNETLDKNLENGISSNATDGFILISFGTVCTAPNMPPSFREAFFGSFEAFPNLQFIWRWKGEMPKIYPTNLLLIPWFNQQKLLAHPKIKGFITQGGRPSIQEAFYHAVPTIAVPILGDQDFNAYRYEFLGTAVYMDISSITQTKLVDVINRTLTDLAWRERVKRMSMLGKDVPTPPLQVALWWTEFILRHTPDELNLLKPLAQKLYWFQRRDLDVWLVLLVCSCGFSLVFYKVGYFLLTKLWSIRRHKDLNKVKGE